MAKGITIGADPEFFLKTSKGEVISAHDLVPGTKGEPHRLTKGAVQADGTAVEFNIDPASTADEFCENIMTTLDEIRDMIPKELEFYYAPHVKYPKKYFDSLPREATELGCDPDFSCFTGKVNVIDYVPTSRKVIRTGGGHIHIGWGEGIDVDDPIHREDCRVVTQYLMLCLQPYLDLTTPRNQRSKLYGGTGAYRPKSYGVEYREPSNFWLSGGEQEYKVLFTLIEEMMSKALDNPRRLFNDRYHWLNDINYQFTYKTPMSEKMTGIPPKHVLKRMKDVKTFR